MIEDPICTTRVYAPVADKSRSADVSIERPKQIEGGDWRCAFFVSGLIAAPLQAGGVDGVQALLLAFEGVARVLDDTGVEWFSDENFSLPDWFPRRVLPTGYGLRLDRHMRGVVQDEITRLRRTGELRAFRMRALRPEPEKEQAPTGEAGPTEDATTREK